MPLNSPVTQALDSLMEKAIQQRDERYFLHEPDPDWPSPCELPDTRKEGQIGWRPVKRDKPIDFTGLEQAIEARVHPDIKAYYGSYYSDSIETFSSEGKVSLIQLWSDKDYERLVGNLVGHYLSKKRLKHAFTVFFATTEEDSELFLSIDNESGIIYLEEPGREPLKQVEQDLASFLKRLTPEK